MYGKMHQDTLDIISEILAAIQPEEAVLKALKEHTFAPGRIILVAAGKAAWQMASAALKFPSINIEIGIVITKYGHSKGPLPGIIIREASHPLPDENGFRATREAERLVRGLTKNDTVLFLLSGGASALFEDPLVEKEELTAVTEKLLSSGADIKEINTIRKRLSSVKGGRFAGLCSPANVFTIAISDVIGDSPDMIASGPTVVDRSTCAEALHIAEEYQLPLSKKGWSLLNVETPKALDNSTFVVSGSVLELCKATEKALTLRGYSTLLITSDLTAEAREDGAFLSAIAKTHIRDNKKMAFILGGETVVHIKGKGKGGRNQEIVLSALIGLRDTKGAAVFSLGSDGTDGPTDAAGGYADSESYNALLEYGIKAEDALDNNDSYNALKAIDSLIFTGATGTNVNDVSVLLLDPALKCPS